MHTHLDPMATPRILALFDQRNVRMAVNLSGGIPGDGLEEALEQARVSGGRVLPFCTLDWRRAQSEDFVTHSVALLERCAALGVRGLKIPKVLGLRARKPDGTLLAVDDPWLDPLFERCGSLGLVVLIHSGDPRAFFEPAAPTNERWDELQVHPGWSFARPGMPSWDAVLSQFERRVLRHPSVRFVGAHFGNAAEDPARVERLLERAPNYFIDTSARIPEFGRHDPARMRRFFTRWQDRVLFGTDLGVGMAPEEDMLGSSGADPPTLADHERFWTATFRYFESADRDMLHPTPIQGRWNVHGVNLPSPILRKLYGANAAGLLRLPWP
jgi:predicted TIM-barrel fold metal-dependent hydrolase